MTRFNYVARDSTGQSVNGTVTAVSPSAASRQLRQEGKFLIRLDSPGRTAPADATSPPTARAAPAQPAWVGHPSDRGVGRKEVIFLTNQLAVMTETGVPLADAMDAVMEQTGNARLKAVLADVAQRVKSGEEFSSSLARHGRIFSPMYVAMVRAAEASGTLGVMLDRVAAYLTDEHETRKKITSALIYPCVMMLFAIAVTVFLMVFVLPRFAEIYADREALLPRPTRVVMAVSNFIVGDWPYLVGGLVGLLVLAVLFFRSDYGRDWWAAAKLKVPLIGGMLHKLYVTRCLRTMGTLIGTGVSMLESVQITREVAGRGPFVALWDGVDKALRSGQQLSDPIFRSGLIPRSIGQMIAAGEKTGRLPDVMDRVAGFCDRDLKTQIKTSTAMIEPIMIMVMGVIVGFVVMALLLPIFNVSKVMTQGGS